MTPTLTSLCVALFVVSLPGATFAGDMQAGRKLAEAQCRTCHGLDGIAQIPIAPHLAGESEIYLQTQLKAFRSGKRQQEMMSVVSKNLSDDDIANVAAWFSVEMPE